MEARKRVSIAHRLCDWGLEEVAPGIVMIDMVTPLSVVMSDAKKARGMQVRPSTHTSLILEEPAFQTLAE
jgi:hypothetical protein